MPSKEETADSDSSAKKPSLEEMKLKALEKRASVKARFKLPKWVTMKEELVITGVSGIYPSSIDVKAYMDNLYASVDMVQASQHARWPTGLFYYCFENLTLLIMCFNE